MCCYGTAGCYNCNTDREIKEAFTLNFNFARSYTKMVNMQVYTAQQSFM